MNFAPFTGHIPTAAAIPSIHQFAAKFGYEGNGGVVQEARYGGGGVLAVAGGALDAVKFRPDGVVVVSAAQPVLAGIGPVHTGGQLDMVNTGVKYQTISASSSSVNLGNVTYGGQSYVQESVQQVKETRTDKREYREEHHQDLMATMMQQQVSPGGGGGLQQGQQLVVVLHEPKEAAAIARAIKQEARTNSDRPHHNTHNTHQANEYIIVGPGVGVGESGDGWALGGGVADYLSALPLPLHHLLKYSADKRDDPTIVTVTNALPAANNIVTVSEHQTQVQTNAANSVVVQTATIVSPANVASVAAPKKKKKKKNVKEKKPRPKPGEIRLTTALDGSTLYCCPECHMAYPERELLEQHLVGHTMERRFICDICNAALKRKDHLTRHKQSHNPERPHVCSVCLKAFKRKEQLTLHFVIHSGEKRHVCNECGKGFYRKDHLRKHTRSHIARRVKAELSAGGGGGGGGEGALSSAARPAPPPPPPAAADC